MTMTPKEIARVADRTFAAAIPHNLVIRDQQDQEDYGIDYEIEVMLPGDRPSGFLFKVQQKGALAFDEEAGGERVVCGGLKVERVRYYLHQIGLPTALVVVDVGKKLSWWVGLQGNTEAAERLNAAETAGHKTMSLAVPKCNALPQSADALVEAMRRSQDAVTVRCVRAATSPHILTAAINTSSLDEATASLRRHSDFLRLEQVERLRRAGDTQAALRACEAIWGSPSETVNMRFAAAVNITRFLGAQTLESWSFDSQERFMQRRQKLLTDLILLVRSEKAAEHLRLYACFLRRSSCLDLLIDRYTAHVHSHHTQPPEGMFVPIVRAAKQHLLQLALRDFARAQALLSRMARRGHRHLLPQAWAMLVGAIGPLAVILRVDGERQAADSLTSWIDRTAETVTRSAAQLGDWEGVALCAMQQLVLGGDPASPYTLAERIETGKALLSHIPDAAVRAVHEGRLMGRVPELSGGPPEMTIEREQDLVRHLARGVGVDLSVRADPFGQVARIGIEDMNPERVLRNCRHLFVCVDSYGSVGEMLGLPTAGVKWVNCTKHGHGLAALSLDVAYSSFRQHHCDGCPDAAPHDTSWRWSARWQQDQDQSHENVIRLRQRFGEQDPPAGEG